MKSNVTKFYTGDKVYDLIKEDTEDWKVNVKYVEKTVVDVKC